MSLCTHKDCVYFFGLILNGKGGSNLDKLESSWLVNFRFTPRLWNVHLLSGYFLWSVEFFCWVLSVVTNESVDIFWGVWILWWVELWKIWIRDILGVIHISDYTKIGHFLPPCWQSADIFDRPPLFTTKNSVEKCFSHQSTRIKFKI